MISLRAAAAAAAFALLGFAVPVDGVHVHHDGEASAARQGGNASSKILGGNASEGRRAVLRGGGLRRDAGVAPARAASHDPHWGDVEPSKLRLLALNTWHEGTVVPGGFDMIVDVIAEAVADVVVLSEVRNAKGLFHERLQAALASKGQIFKGQFRTGDVALLSRWPIEKVDVVTQNVAAYHLAAPRPIVVCTAHLDHHHYATILPRGYDANDYSGGAYRELKGPVTDVDKIHAVDEASARGPALEAFLAYAASLRVPVVLAGDFNEPSHLDWTRATADLYDHNGVEIEWHHSRMLCDAGFRDSWRELHPDPVTHPGFTWPSDARGWGNTGWAPKADERDRIDFVYHNAQGITTSESWLVGSPRYYLRGGLMSADAESQCPFLPRTRNLPWPSDHKGLFVEFTVAYQEGSSRWNWPPEMGGVRPGSLSLGRAPRRNASSHR